MENAEQCVQTGVPLCYRIYKKSCCAVQSAPERKTLSRAASPSPPTPLLLQGDEVLELHALNLNSARLPIPGEMFCALL